jgi:hypothetical protein
MGVGLPVHRLPRKDCTADDSVSLAVEPLVDHQPDHDRDAVDSAACPIGVLLAKLVDGRSRRNGAQNPLE